MRQTTQHSVDHEILTFGRTWYSYGGGSDEDIYVAFGVDGRTYFERLRRVVASPLAADLTAEARLGIESICAARLDATGP